MNGSRPLFLLLAATLLAALPGYGQMAISAKAGLINVADGEVYVDGKLVEPKPSEFVTIPRDGLLKTAEGRAEVLLTPGAFLRMADFGSFRLLNNDLSSVVVDLLEGAALVEITELSDANSITLRAKDQTIQLKKAGIYLVEVTPQARVRVYGSGEAEVSIDDKTYFVKGNRELIPGANGWTVAKFDSKDTDPLYRWAMRRSEYIAMANLSAARTATGPSRNSFFGGTGGLPGAWIFNPFFGTMTYVPWGNNVISPFGFAYFNPFSAYRFYINPRPVYSGPDPWQSAGGGNMGRWSGGGGGMVRGGDSSIGSARGTSGGFSGAVAGSSSAGSAGGGGAASAGGGARGGRGQ